MKRQLTTGIGAAAILTAVVGAGFGVITSTAAASTSAPHAKSHTETFLSRGDKNINLGNRKTFVDFAKDIEHGKAVGGDSATGAYNPKTGDVTADFSVLRKGGVLYGKFTLDTHTGLISGKILGGLDAFKGDRGTVFGHAVNNKDSKVTLTYHG
jgi:hypothetical protein